MKREFSKMRGVVGIVTVLLACGVNADGVSRLWCAVHGCTLIPRGTPLPLPLSLPSMWCRCGACSHCMNLCTAPACVLPRRTCVEPSTVATLPIGSTGCCFHLTLCECGRNAFPIYSPRCPSRIAWLCVCVRFLDVTAKHLCNDLGPGAGGAPAYGHTTPCTR
jgi:hypothetical protein